jgi:hypothetical protein
MLMGKREDRMVRWIDANPRAWRLINVTVLGTCALVQIHGIRNQGDWWGINVVGLVVVVGAMASNAWVWTRHDRLEELRQHILDQTSDRYMAEVSWLWGREKLSLRDLREINQWLRVHHIHATPVDDMHPKVRTLRRVLVETVL